MTPLPGPRRPAPLESDPMTGLPQEAIDAGIKAVRAYRRRTHAINQTTRSMAVTAVEAAAPHIAAAERERIRQLATSRNAQYVRDCPDPDCPGPSAHMADETAPFAGLLTEGDTT